MLVMRYLAENLRGIGGDDTFDHSSWLHIESKCLSASASQENETSFSQEKRFEKIRQEEIVK